MIKYILFIALIFSIVSDFYGQDIRVENMSNGENVENVAIYNQDKSRSVLSDLDGRASIDIFMESDTLYFQHPSYIRQGFSYAEVQSRKLVKLERKNILIPEFVITASKHRENQHDIAYMVDVVSSKEVGLLPAQTSADLLSSTGNIFVQKSQAGGGSPVLRGFEANKVLLVVDGVRMNNAIYRSGHLQNSITIDNAILKRAEIIYGPSSVIYGSDALGGVIHYITKEPEFSDSTHGIYFDLNAYSQVATGVHSLKNHLDFNLGRERFASLSSITYGNFGDVRTGTRRDPFIGDWGIQDWYVQRVDGVDSVLSNDVKNKLLLTGYSQLDVLQKFRFQPSVYANFSVNLQYSGSSNINRYDQLNNSEDGIPEYAEWYYGPQERFLASFKSELTAHKGIYSSFVSTLGFQQIQESRYTRNFQDDTLYKNIEDVQVLSANFDFIKFLSGGKNLNYGLEYNQNFVESSGFKENISDNSELPYLSRYPDDGTVTLNLGAYVSYKAHLGDKIIASIGGRYQYYHLNSKYGDMYSQLPDLFTDVNLNNNSFTGSLSFIYDQSKSLNWNLILSTGYRSPNLDDLAKMRVSSGKLTLPNANLKPENSYNVELGLTKTFDGYIQISGQYFLTYLTDAIIRTSYTLADGSDSLFFQGGYQNTYINVNSDEALLHGFNIKLLSDLNSNIRFKSTLNYIFGKNLSDDLPLAHISPVFGRTVFSYETKKFVSEVYLVYSGWKRMEDMALTGEDKDDEATEFGFPGWYTINFNSSLSLNKHVTLQLAIENLTDNFYQPFASGIPAPGISFIATLKVHL